MYYDVGSTFSYLFLTFDMRDLYVILWTEITPSVKFTDPAWRSPWKIMDCYDTIGQVYRLIYITSEVRGRLPSLGTRGEFYSLYVMTIQPYEEGYLLFNIWGDDMCNEHGTIYAISSVFGDRMTTQSMGLI